ncbi:MAG: hypothetical protein KF819_37650 [Labilithrix sp.]|nr:hypothetical protein [Labilithrix sp.]
MRKALAILPAPPAAPLHRATDGRTPPSSRRPADGRVYKTSATDHAIGDGVVLAFGLPSHAKAPLQDAASLVGLRVLEARHLNAACSALAMQPCVLVIASTSARSWDRVVLEDHCARAGVTVAWVEPDATYDVAERAVRAAAAHLRPRRTPHAC